MNQRELDKAAESYDPAENNYDIALDPRCLFGWGGCVHRFGHTCFRAVGHPGKCRDVDSVAEYRLACETKQRPKNWDTKGRIEANR